MVACPSARVWLLAASFSLLGIACSGQAGPDPGPDPEPTDEHHERFVGLWLVDQPYHALYEATFYEFDGTGGLRTGASTPPDCGAHLHRHCVTGSVADTASDVTCVFGGRWHSLDSATLVIVGDCSDGVERDIVLDFADDPAGNAVDAGVELISVGGDTAWFHDNWDWRFQRCAEGASEALPECCAAPRYCE